MRLLVLSNLDLPSAHALLAFRALLPDAEISVLLTTQVGQVPTESQPGLALLAETDRTRLCQFLQCDQGSESEVLRAALQEQLRCAVVFSPGVNRPSGQRLISAFDPDLMVSIRFGEILKAATIKLSRGGVLNLHSGRLPELRGVMATFWAMLNNAPFVGMTVHWIEDQGIDSGTIVTLTRQPLDLDASYLDNTLMLYPEGVKALADAVRTLGSGQRLPARLARGADRYYGYPLRQDLQRFADAGYRLV